MGNNSSTNSNQDIHIQEQLVAKRKTAINNFFAKLIEFKKWDQAKRELQIKCDDLGIEKHEILSVNIKGPTKNTLVGTLIKLGRIDVFRQMLEDEDFNKVEKKGAITAKQGPYKESNLHLAVNENSNIWIDALLKNFNGKEKQAFLMRENNFGVTAAHNAAAQGNASILYNILYNHCNSDNQRKHLILNKVRDGDLKNLNCIKLAEKKGNMLLASILTEIIDPTKTLSLSAVPTKERVEFNNLGSAKERLEFLSKKDRFDIEEYTQKSISRTPPSSPKVSFADQASVSDQTSISTLTNNSIKQINKDKKELFGKTLEETIKKIYSKSIKILSGETNPKDKAKLEIIEATSELAEGMNKSKLSALIKFLGRNKEIRSKKKDYRLSETINEESLESILNLTKSSLSEILYPALKTIDINQVEKYTNVVIGRIFNFITSKENSDILEGTDQFYDSQVANTLILGAFKGKSKHDTDKIESNAFLTKKNVLIKDLINMPIQDRSHNSSSNRIYAFIDQVELPNEEFHRKSSNHEKECTEYTKKLWDSLKNNEIDTDNMVECLNAFKRQNKVVQSYFRDSDIELQYSYIYPPIGQASTYINYDLVSEIFDMLNYKDISHEIELKKQEKYNNDYNAELNKSAISKDNISRLRFLKTRMHLFRGIQAEDMRLSHQEIISKFLNELLEAYPDNDEILLQDAFASNFVFCHPPEIIKHKYQKVLDKNPNQQNANFNLGKLLMQEENTERAENLFNKVVDHGNNRMIGRAYKALGEIYYNKSMEASDSIVSDSYSNKAREYIEIASNDYNNDAARRFYKENFKGIRRTGSSLSNNSQRLGTPDSDSTLSIRSSSPPTDINKPSQPRWSDRTKKRQPAFKVKQL